MMLIFLVSGCQASVKKVSVGNIILYIPSDWHLDEIDETSDIDEELEPYTRMEIYGPETADKEIYSLTIFCEDIRGYHESIGSPYSYEANSDYYWGYLKDEYIIASYGVLWPYMEFGETQSMKEPVTLSPKSQTG